MTAGEVAGLTEQLKGLRDLMDTKFKSVADDITEIKDTLTKFDKRLHALEIAGASMSAKMSFIWGLVGVLIGGGVLALLQRVLGG